MGNQQEIKLLYEIAAAIKKAGYVPATQLDGYIQTGNLNYITRTDNAREKIKTVSLYSIKEFLKMIK